VYNLDGSYNKIESAKDYLDLKPSSGTLEKGATYYIPVVCKNSKLNTLTVTYYFGENQTNGVSLATDSKTDTKLELGKIYDLGTPVISTDPELTLNKNSVSGISAEAANDLTIAEAYTLNNCSDSDVTVTYDETVVTAASISGGTVTYSVSANTGSARDGWIGLALAGGDVQKITVSQLASGATEDYIWNFSTTEWQAALVAQANDGCRETNDNSNTTFDVSYDGLSYYSGSGNGKWSQSGYIMPNGSGYYKENDKRRYWSFTTTNGGYVYVTLSGTGTTSKDATVYVVQSAKSQADFTSEKISATSSETKRVEIAITAGTQYLYLSTGMQVKIIEFHQNQLTD